MRRPILEMTAEIVRRSADMLDRLSAYEPALPDPRITIELNDDAGIKAVFRWPCATVALGGADRAFFILSEPPVVGVIPPEGSLPHPLVAALRKVGP